MLINNPEEMFHLGYNCSKTNTHLLLYGQLGAGKTTFTKGFASGLGIDPNIVHSPTYTYLNIYNNKLLHIDLYRIETYDEFLEKGLLEIIYNFDYVIIEWPKFEDKLSDFHWTKINIEKDSFKNRSIIINS